MATKSFELLSRDVATAKRITYLLVVRAIGARGILQICSLTLYEVKDLFQEKWGLYQERQELSESLLAVIRHLLAQELKEERKINSQNQENI